ncbi:MAG: glutathione S-transferase [Gammaproteobacteria bacterium]|nr:glutathione S-transferase [Gammaproteobacteria bacterium]
MTPPVLYSFRRCPYCMRAHMALKYCGLKIELREVDLKDYPEQALQISPKATVPVLQLSDGTVIDESWDIVKWALQQNDTDHWSGDNNSYLQDAEMLIETNDFSFKEDLDRYKYAERFPEHGKEYYRQACEEFIEELEVMLNENDYLLGKHLSLADIGIFPFVRQFSLVDKNWFQQSPYPKVNLWLNNLTTSALFESVFQKHAIWKHGDGAIFV